MREIVLDTETTGLDALRGDRLIEIGCVEIINRVPSGNEFHRFINPETRPVHPDAQRIHGISTEFLRDKPLFSTVWRDFLAYIGDAPLVIHNANFDIGFINMELGKVGQGPIEMTRVVDTLQLARRKHPGGPNTLDALCKRYNIDNSKRTKHGAIVDSLLLAEVYIELLGERQATLGLSASVEPSAANENQSINLKRPGKAMMRPSPLPARLHDEVVFTHAKYIETLGTKSIWSKYKKPDQNS